MNGKSCVVLLRTQYRIIPAVSYWPNQEFYEGKIMDGVFRSQRLPIPGLPLPAEGVQSLFYAVEGMAIKSGTSWYNPFQDRMVVTLATQALQAKSDGRVAGRDIGIITQYAAQKTEIDGLLKTANREANMKPGKFVMYQAWENDVISVYYEGRIVNGQHLTIGETTYTVVDADV